MPHLIIVGAGPAGAALAYLLARRDIEVTLLERQTDFAREFRGEGLQPSGIDAFGQMGLGDAFDALPHCLFDAIQFHRYTRPLFRLDLAGGGPRWVSQPAMLEMLVEHAGTCPSFTLVRGARVHDLIRRDDRVAGVRYAVGDDEREVVGDDVVATDGRDSTVRKRVSLDLVHIHQSFDVVWCKMPSPAPTRGLGTVRRCFWATRTSRLCFHPTMTGCRSAGSSARGRSAISTDGACLNGSTRWPATSRRSWATTCGGRWAAREHISHPFLLNVICGNLERSSATSSEPGLLLLGDAAHPMSPVGGQGINLALRDALVAANHLVPLLRGQPTPGALDMAAVAIAQERLPEIVRIQRVQQLPPRQVFAGGWRASLTLGMARLLVGSGLAPLLFAPVARQLGGGVTSVRLDV